MSILFFTLQSYSDISKASKIEILHYASHGEDKERKVFIVNRFVNLRNQINGPKSPYPAREQQPKRPNYIQRIYKIRG